MPESTVLVKSVTLYKGVSKKTGKPYEQTVLIDGNDQKHTSWGEEMFPIAKPFEGKQAVIDTMPNGVYSDLLSVKAAPEDPREKLGTGEYVGAKTAPENKRGMDANCALTQAVATLTHTIPVDATSAQIHTKIATLADLYFAWLQYKSGFGPTEQDEADSVPF